MKTFDLLKKSQGKKKAKMRRKKDGKINESNMVDSLQKQERSNVITGLLVSSK